MAASDPAPGRGRRRRELGGLPGDVPPVRDVPPVLLELSDTDGDPVHICAEDVVAVTVGRLNGPSRVAGQAAPLVTVVHTTAGPFVVSEPAEGIVRVLKMTRAVVAPGRNIPLEVTR